jgi:hypothetical protein
MEMGMFPWSSTLEDAYELEERLDVKKVQAEVRHAELENVRLAARALESEREDPDIEKKIVIETDTDGTQSNWTTTDASPSTQSELD